MATAQEILDTAFRRASENIQSPQVANNNVTNCLNEIVKNKRNRAAVRLILTCAFVKIFKPEIDPRQPYIKIKSSKHFSGRTYDTRYIGPFVVSNELRCNSTTAFLTPALRNINKTLTLKTKLEGRPAIVYESALIVLDAMYTGVVKAEDVLVECLRLLLVQRKQIYQSIANHSGTQKTSAGKLSLATEQIVSLITQHLQSDYASRLPVLLVAAAFEAAAGLWWAVPRSLHAHLAADAQTGAVGDVEIVDAANEERVRIGFEMKFGSVKESDIYNAFPKIRKGNVEKYLFISTVAVKAEIKDYAATCYKLLGGVEVAVLDCVEFIRYFLHLFYNQRIKFLEVYEGLLQREPESAVGQDLKDKWSDLRRIAESRLAEPEE